MTIFFVYCETLFMLLHFTQSTEDEYHITIMFLAIGYIETIPFAWEIVIVQLSTSLFVQLKMISWNVVK